MVVVKLVFVASAYVSQRVFLLHICFEFSYENISDFSSRVRGVLGPFTFTLLLIFLYQAKEKYYEVFSRTPCVTSCL